MAENEKTAPTVPAAIGTEQPLQMDCTNSITENSADFNSSEDNFELMMKRMLDPTYLPTISMTELYNNIYDKKQPLIDGLLYAGVYLFVGAPKVGKSFLMAQIAYHVSTGTELWGYPVNKGEVLYLALEDDYARLQRRLYRMFGSDKNDNLMFATKVDSINGLLFSFEKATVSLRECRTGMKQGRGSQRVLPLPLGERRTLDVDEACEINVKGIMALLLAQQ